MGSESFWYGIAVGWFGALAVLAVGLEPEWALVVGLFGPAILGLIVHAYRY